PTYTYTRPGSYTVRLIINPNSGCPDTLIKTAYIQVNGATARFLPIPPAGCAPLAVTFRDSSFAFMSTITSWSWNFGDPGSGSNTSNLQNPQHTFDNPGTYTVRLTVTDANGCVKDTTRPVRAVRTVAAFTSDTIVCPGVPLQFTNQSTSSNVRFWNFGDPNSASNTSTANNPSHTYD